MSDFINRIATVKDIPFLANTIIEAEKSGTDKLSYSTIFGLSEDESRKYIIDMLSEEVDGCELSVSSFFVAESAGQVVAAVSVWIEGVDGIPSSVLKGNLLSYTLPQHCIERAVSIFPIIRDLQIEYEHDTIILGNGHVVKEFRGNNLLGILMSERMKQLSLEKPGIKNAFAQVFECNTPSLRTCEKLGFHRSMVKTSTNDEILQYLPYHSKVLLKKSI
ncbi:MAG: GNAT family protein [Bacteroidales bacterium]|nr:GNAT family protein [Bacteroidales bacterium]